MKTIQAQDGEEIYDFALRLLATSRAAGEWKIGIFNDLEILAAPHMTYREVLEQWDVIARRDYFGPSAKFRTLSN